MFSRLLDMTACCGSRWGDKALCLRRLDVDTGHGECYFLFL